MLGIKPKAKNNMIKIKAVLQWMHVDSQELGYLEESLRTKKITMSTGSFPHSHQLPLGQ